MEREFERHVDIVASARKMYQDIGSVVCPTLSGEVIRFTSAGFNHLLRSGRVQRSKTEQLRRLRLLPSVKEALGRRDIVIEYREISGKFSDRIFFWGLSVVCGQKELTVVIRQIGPHGHKHFFSVMDSDIKKTP